MRMDMDSKAENCDLGGEMLAYMYDEVSETDRTRFETHLIDCSFCTDEFAAVSNSRFAVYEWKREEFDPIATPQFVITMEPSLSEASGWAAGFRGLFAGWPAAIAFAGAALAFVGVGLFAIEDTRGTGEVAATTSVPAVISKANDAPMNAPLAMTEPLPTQSKKAESVRIQNVSAPATVQTRMRAKVHTTILRGTENTATRAMNVPLNKKPVLSNLGDEDVDRTLRLTDLFDDGGV
jgi:anti-sigma factor RsiW